MWLVELKWRLQPRDSFMKIKDNPLIKTSAIVSVISGLIILFSAVYPIVSYEKLSKQKYPTFLSPLSSDEVPMSYSLDYTKASNWFVGENQNIKGKSVGEGVNSYKLSVPKLGIKDAIVKIGGEDLSESLIHFGGTNEPGKIGNAVVFGHSILPQFFDSKNYLAIFSTLPTLDEGDEIFVDYDGISFKYKIVNMYEVLPTDVDVLDQPVDDSYISLITCVPPGHPLKPRRLVVRAKIVSPDVAYTR